MKFKLLPIILVTSIIFFAFVSLIPLNDVSAFTPINASESCFTTSSHSCNFTINIASGSYLIIFLTSIKLASQGCPSATITESLGNSLSQEANDCVSGGTLRNQYLMDVSIVTLTGTDTITCSDIATIIYVGCGAIDINSIAASPNIKFYDSAVSTTPISTQTFIVGYNGLGNTGNSGTWSTDTGFSLVPNIISSVQNNQAMEYCFQCTGSSSFSNLIYSQGSCPCNQLGASMILNIIVQTTYTQTITGWVFPNFINGTATYSWFWMLGVLLFPVAFIGEIAYQKKNGGYALDSKAPIFLTLVSLFIGSIIGAFVNFVPVLFPFLFGILLALYIWKGS